MNVKQASIKWRCAKRTVQNYCEKEYIPGVELKPNGYYIPDNARRPGFSKATTAIKIYDNLLDHTNNQKSVSYRNYGIDEALFNAYCDQLLSIAWISEVKTESQKVRSFILTPLGMKYIKATHAQKQDMLFKSINTAVTAAFGAAQLTIAANS